MTLVEQYGFQRAAREFGSADVDVVLRLLLELTNRFRVELPLDPCVADRGVRQRSGKDDLFGLLPDPREVAVRSGAYSPISAASQYAIVS